MLYEKILGDPSFFYSRSKTFVEFYLKAYDRSHKFFENISMILARLGPWVLSNKIFQEHHPEEIKYFLAEASHISYDLGLHMAFTIQTTFELNEEKFLNLSIGQFLRLYEEACKKRNVQPLISLTGNKGKLFDYKEALRMLYRAEKQAKSLSNA